MCRKYCQDKEFSKSLKDFVVTFVKTRTGANGCISISPQPFKLVGYACYGVSNCAIRWINRMLRAGEGGLASSRPELGQ